MKDDTFDLIGLSADLSFLFPEHKSSRNNRKGVYFIIVLQGEAFIEIDGKTYTLCKGILVCLTPGHLLLKLSHSNNFLCQYLLIEYDFLSDFPLLLKADISDKMGAIPCVLLEPKNYSLLTRYYELISDRYHDNHCQVEVIKGLLFSFILEVSRIYSGQEIDVALSRKHELTDGFFHLLHQYYKEERAASFYAGRLCITDKHLLRTIKEMTGNTFYFWVTDFIIKEAKLLLKSTDKSVTEISEELKLPNSSFFARFFKKHTGMSPLQFRKAGLKHLIDSK